MMWSSSIPILFGAWVVTVEAVVAAAPLVAMRVSTSLLMSSGLGSNLGLSPHDLEDLLALFLVMLEGTCSVAVESDVEAVGWFLWDIFWSRCRKTLPMDLLVPEPRMRGASLLRS